MTEVNKNRLGKQKQAWTERAARRATRACPDRILRILPDGTLELVPMAGEAQQEKAGDWDKI